MQAEKPMPLAQQKAPGTPRAQQADRVKTAIIEAAIPLFARGYDSVSIQQIAAAADVKHSLVMYHFGSKDQLWEAAATRLMKNFDQRQRDYAAKLPKASNDEEMIYQQMTAFIQALRDIPEYGQILLSEGSQKTERLQWLHLNFFPSVVNEKRFNDSRISEVLLHTTLLRNAVAGAMLYTVVAGPQLARSAELEGGEKPDDLYPMSDNMAGRLARMLTDFLLSQLAKL